MSLITTIVPKLGNFKFKPMKEIDLPPKLSTDEIKQIFKDNPKVWIIYDRGYSTTEIDANGTEIITRRSDRIYFYDDYFHRNGNELCTSNRQTTLCL